MEPELPIEPTEYILRTFKRGVMRYEFVFFIAESDMSSTYERRIQVT